MAGYGRNHDRAVGQLLGTTAYRAAARAASSGLASFIWCGGHQTFRYLRGFYHFVILHNTLRERNSLQGTLFS